MKNKINWKIFSGSSHCEEGLAEFAKGEIKTYKEFKQYFLPHMKDVAEEVDRMKNSKTGIVKVRKLAARAFKRICGLSITEAYN
jgi:hypothetical protein